jgi:hypothetical protein
MGWAVFPERGQRLLLLYPQVAKAVQSLCHRLTSKIRNDDVAKSVALWIVAGVYIARVNLQSAERAAREAIALGKFCRFGWTFSPAALLSDC